MLGPILVTFGFSFVDWPGYGEMVFTGLDNYARALGDSIYISSFRHAAIYIGLTIILEVAAGLAMAGIITSRRGMGWFRIAFFTPVMLPMVVIAVLWSFVYNPDFGMINTGLRATGLDGLALIWLGDTRTALLAISIVSGWIFAGFYMAIFYAAFEQIPNEIIEAARIDGAGEWRIFFGIKVPVIRRTVEVAILLCITGGFQSFDLFYVMTGGGPYHATEIPTTYLVRVVFRNHEVGYGSALAVIMTAVVVVVGVLFLRLRRRAGQIGALNTGAGV